jgi:hypothetical protein
MGNGTSSSSIVSSSSQETSKKLRETLNLIATQFILSNDFKSLKLLVNEKYCDNLTILTKDILSTRFSTKQIKSLAKMDTLFYISKNELSRIEAGTRDKKNLMCKQIARFYVRIAQLFASIITTVYPNWSDTVGPEGKPFDGNDFCQTRIAALTKSIRPDSGDKSKVAIQPTVCSLYANDSTVYAAPGFAALELLYNDQYDETTGAFSKRSGEMQSKYETDLTTLYQAFTGHSSKPPEIKSFSDINISALSKRFKECGPKTSDPVFAPGAAVQTGGQMFDDRVDRDRINSNVGQAQVQVQSDMEKELESVRIKAEAREKSIKAQGENLSGIFSSSNPAVKIASTNGAFSKYAVHIKTMVASAERYKAALLAVIDKLFLIVKTEAGQPKITIHPALSNEELDKLVNQTRDIIVQLYLGCERDFYTGLKLLRVIIEEKMQENMEAALSALKTETKTTIKNISSKQRIKNESDVTRRQDEVNQLQQFQNPVFDEEMQKAKADAANEKYNKKKNLEYEIKQLEQEQYQKETDKKDFESKIAYYESQIKQLDAKSDTLQIEALQKKMNDAKILLTDIDTQLKTIEDNIAEKREELRKFLL